jgi:ABC-type glycerol-3-phosphate transport system substrate-binding protein
MKSKNINILVLLIIVLTFVMLLAACGGGDTATPEAPAADEPAVEEPADEEPAMEDVTITYWHTMSDPETEQLANVVAAFEAANPGIKWRRRASPMMISNRHC